MTKSGRWQVMLFWAAASLATSRAYAADGDRLYTLDCGHADFDNGAPLSDTGEYEGKAVSLADPCFLIRHPKGWLLWDAGLPSQTPASAAELDKLGVRMSPGPPLAGQLAQLGLRPAQVDYLSFSHLHFDHMGNANLFTASTWILNRNELAWAEAEPAHVSMTPQLFSGYRTAKTRMIDGDLDVFGDGTVRILRAPGHTPGSQALLVKLARSGPVLLLGDLYLSAENRRLELVPTAA
ncbi:MAG: hypothetical protein JWQ90_662 [Hydrocarboniphaga sp.]|nr:hypothetical protein [Hydrocarboniphaga sp.]